MRFGSVYIGFNSKLVRLKVQQEVVINLIFNRFNSKLVRLKEVCPEGFGSLDECFNSKLVRLKEVRRCARSFFKKLFQFQTGAIKSPNGKDISSSK